MPRYSYACATCGTFEEMRPMSAYAEPAHAPDAARRRREIAAARLAGTTRSQRRRRLRPAIGGCGCCKTPGPPGLRAEAAAAAAPHERLAPLSSARLTRDGACPRLKPVTGSTIRRLEPTRLLHAVPAHRPCDRGSLRGEPRGRAGQRLASSILTVSCFASILAIAAIGQTLVIQQGGLDLSVPGVISLAAVLVTKFPDGDNSALALWIVAALAAAISPE